jgi:hypothetical protein
MAAGGVDRRDARAGQACEQLGLASKPLKRGGAVDSPEELHGDLPQGLPLPTEVDPPHAPLGDQPLDDHVAHGHTDQRIGAGSVVRGEPETGRCPREPAVGGMGVALGMGRGIGGCGMGRGDARVVRFLGDHGTTPRDAIERIADSESRRAPQRSVAIPCEGTADPSVFLTRAAPTAGCDEPPAGGLSTLPS